MLNICYFISDVDKSFNLEWMFKYLDKSKVNISCVLLRNEKTALEDFLILSDIKVLRLSYGKKYILRNIFKSILFLKKNKIQVVHCHLFEASFVGLLAARVLGIKKRIHTRHNSSIHHDYHPHAVKYDKLINSLSTKIISISDVVTDILIKLEGVAPEKIVKIPHGFDFVEMEFLGKKYYNETKQKYSLSENNFTIGVISRYIKYKGLEFIIPAFKEFHSKIPNAKLILANAAGPEAPTVNKLLAELPKDSYTQIVFEPNIYSLFSNFDAFVHTPININAEAFGQVYIESMFFGVPGVFTRSGVACEIVSHENNGLVVDYKNTSQISDAIMQLYTSSTLSEKIAANAKKKRCTGI